MKKNDNMDVNMSNMIEMKKKKVNLLLRQSNKFYDKKWFFL